MPLTELNLLATVKDRGAQILAATFGTAAVQPMVTTSSLLSRRPKSRALPWLVVTLVLGLDQLSKRWVLTALGKVGSTVVLPGPIDLTLVLNYSNAFGLVPVSGELTRWGLVVLNLAIASILVAVVLRRVTARLTTVGFAFVAAGAIGNALDRIRFGAVVDLFDASKLGFIWIFNVADVSIDIGIALLLLATFLPRFRSTCANFGS